MSRNRRVWTALGVLGLLALLAAALLVWRGLDPATAAQGALQRAREAYAKDDLVQAMRWVNEAIELQPRDAGALAMRDQITTRRIRKREEQAPPVATTPAPPDEIDLIRSLLQSGDAESARSRLARLDRPNDRQEASWLLSRALLQLGNLAAASAALNAAGDFAARNPARFEPAPLVGSSRCAECHQANSTPQRASRHARTLIPVETLTPGDYPSAPAIDPGNPRVTHTVHHDDRGMRIETRTGGITLHAFVRYVLGSGNRGQSFLGRTENGQEMVLRLSFFNAEKSPGLTPMIPLDVQLAHDYLGKGLTADQMEGCLSCHTTHMTRSADRKSVNVVEPGIGCESCHGPGGNHLKAVASHFPDLAIGQPRLASAAQIVAVCARCHQPPGGVEPDPADPTYTRQQTFTMPRSRCYTESNGGMSCVTCHNPHRDVETAPAFYERKCLECHSEQKAGPARHVAKTTCPVNPRTDCLTCHMPRVENPTERSFFTDHEIRVHRDERKQASR